jgi:ketosteroid isomerase-like protein
MKNSEEFLKSSSVIVVVLALGLTACASSSPLEAEGEVRASLEAFYGAIKRGDGAGAMALVAPDAVFVEMGRLETRDEYEKNHLPADIGFEKQVDGTRSPWQVTVEGNTAWAIATTDYDGAFDGRPVSFVSSQLAVLSREDGRWLIRSIHWSSRPL